MKSNQIVAEIVKCKSKLPEGVRFVEYPEGQRVFTPMALGSGNPTASLQCQLIRDSDGKTVTVEMNQSDFLTLDKISLMGKIRDKLKAAIEQFT